MKSKPTFAFTLLTGIALAAGSASTSLAAVIVVLPTSTAAGKLEFTQDINFNITVGGSAIRTLVFDEWVASDGTVDQNSTFSPLTLSYSLNGGTPTTAGITFLLDNYNTTFGAITANDGYLLISGPTVTLGNVFTVKAAIYPLAAGSSPAGFNPLAAQTFTGNMFVTDFNGTSLSGPTSAGAVPEPGAALLGAIGALGLLRRRRGACDEHRGGFLDL